MKKRADRIPGYVVSAPFLLIIVMQRHTAVWGSARLRLMKVLLEDEASGMKRTIAETGRKL